MNEQEFKSLAPPEAVELALTAHGGGDLESAGKLYGWLLEQDPAHAEAMHYLGVLLHQQGRSEAGLDLIRKSIELDAQQPAWHNDLGNVLATCQAPSTAGEAFMASLELDPNNAMVWNNLGAVLQKQEQFDEAAYAYRQALALNPGFVDALNNLGNLLSTQDKGAESAEYLCRAYIAAATEATPRDQLGIAYYTLGRLDEAREVYREWLLEEPDNPIAAHLYAACAGQEVPLRASDAYVEKHFDEMAKSFDAKLVENLDYQVPRLIAQALSRHALPEQKLIGLDAGCGTGLCGVQIAPYVDRLTGIDLSANMLALARQTGVYDELVKAELTRFLFEHPNAYDLVVIADTLIYFGPLDEIFAAAGSALRPGGLCIFTVEETLSAGDPYGIKPNGRYGHGRAYLASLLPAHGLEVVEILPSVIRTGLRHPVKGFAVTARSLPSR